MHMMCKAFRPLPSARCSPCRQVRSIPYGPRQPSIRCCSLPNEAPNKRKEVPTYLVTNNTFNGDVYVSLGEAKAPAQWDAVAISPKAKALLQEHAIKASTALKMHKILGFEDVDDIQRLTPDLIAQLKLKPLQLDPLISMLQQYRCEAPVQPVQQEQPQGQQWQPLLQQGQQQLQLQLPELKQHEKQQQPGVQQVHTPQPSACTAVEPVVDINSCYLAITPDGRRALSVASNESNVLDAWDLATGAKVGRMEVHLHTAFRMVAITPVGRRAVACVYDAKLYVLDLATYSCLATLVGHTQQVLSVAITPDGRHAVSGSMDRKLRVWDLATYSCVAKLEGHTDWVRTVAISPDGRTAVSGSDDHTLRVWDLATRTCTATLRGHTDFVRTVAITPDGRQVVSGSRDDTLRLWSLATHTCVGTLKGHTNDVTCVVITPDGRHAVSGSNDTTLRLWDLATCSCVTTIGGLKECISHVIVTPDGGHVLASSHDHSPRAGVWSLAALLGTTSAAAR